MLEPWHLVQKQRRPGLVLMPKLVVSFTVMPQTSKDLALTGPEKRSLLQFVSWSEGRLYTSNNNDVRGQELRVMREVGPGSHSLSYSSPVPNKPYGPCGRKAP